MNTFFAEIPIISKREGDIIDITQNVQQMVTNSGLQNGIVCVFVGGSTGAITTMEYEPGLQKDLPHALDRLAPKNQIYAHHETWHDDNGHSHVRASIIGPSLTLPFRNKKILHGTWQQIVFLEFDTQGRHRNILVQVLGEK